MRIDLVLNNKKNLLFGVFLLCPLAFEGNAAVLRSDADPSLYRAFETQHASIAEKVCGVSLMGKDGSLSVGAAPYLGSHHLGDKHYFITAAHVADEMLQYNVRTPSGLSTKKMMAFISCSYQEKEMTAQETSVTYHVDKVHYHPEVNTDCFSGKCKDLFKNVDVAILEVHSSGHLGLSPSIISFDKKALDPVSQEPYIYVGWGWTGSNIKGRVNPIETMLKNLDTSSWRNKHHPIINKVNKKAKSPLGFSISQGEENILLDLLKSFQSYIPPRQVCQVSLASSSVRQLHATGNKKEKEYLENRYIQTELPLPKALAKILFSGGNILASYQAQFAVDTTLPPFACSPTSGDSGGAIFDAEGHFLGIHTRVDFTGSRLTGMASTVFLYERLGFQPTAEFLAPFLTSSEETTKPKADL